MSEWWHVVPDSERLQWEADPFVRVGPLHFGMSPDDVSDVLSGLTAEGQRYTSHRAAGQDRYTKVQGEYRKLGLKLYYLARERLCGVAVDGLCGPQVVVDGIKLVGRVPSEVEQRMLDRAETREPHAELTYIGAGEPGSERLGVFVGVQRAGDRLVTRPVFLPVEAMDDPGHFLPAEAWAIR